MGDLSEVEDLVISLTNDSIFDLAYRLTSAKIAAGYFHQHIKQLNCQPGEMIDKVTISSWSAGEFRDKFGRFNPLTVTIIVRSDLHRLVLDGLRKLSRQRLETVDPTYQPAQWVNPENGNRQQY